MASSGTRFGEGFSSLVANECPDASINFCSCVSISRLLYTVRGESLVEHRKMHSGSVAIGARLGLLPVVLVVRLSFTLYFSVLDVQ